MSDRMLALPILLKVGPALTAPPADLATILSGLAFVVATLAIFLATLAIIQRQVRR